MEDLLLRLVADGAGVVQDQTGGFLVLDARVALMLQRPDHFLGIMGIHLAPEGLDVEGFYGAAHKRKYTRRPEVQVALACGERHDLDPTEREQGDGQEM